MNLIIVFIFIISFNILNELVKNFVFSINFYNKLYLDLNDLIY